MKVLHLRNCLSMLYTKTNIDKSTKKGFCISNKSIVKNINRRIEFDLNSDHAPFTGIKLLKR